MPPLISCRNTSYQLEEDTATPRICLINNPQNKYKKCQGQHDYPLMHWLSFDNNEPTLIVTRASDSEQMIISQILNRFSITMTRSIKKSLFFI